MSLAPPIQRSQRLALVAAGIESPAVGRDRFLVGSPETVIRQLQSFEQAFGVDHLICRLFFPGIPHDFIMNELRLLANEVMPAFKP